MLQIVNLFVVVGKSCDKYNVWSEGREGKRAPFMYSQTVLAFCFQTPTYPPNPPHHTPSRMSPSAICACHTKQKHTLVSGNKLCLHSTLSMMLHRTHTLVCRNRNTKHTFVCRNKLCLRSIHSMSKNSRQRWIAFTFLSLATHCPLLVYLLSEWGTHRLLQLKMDTMTISEYNDSNMAGSHWLVFYLYSVYKLIQVTILPMNMAGILFMIAGIQECLKPFSKPSDRYEAGGLTQSSQQSLLSVKR